MEPPKRARFLINLIDTIFPVVAVIAYSKNVDRFWVGPVYVLAIFCVWAAISTSFERGVFQIAFPSGASIARVFAMTVLVIIVVLAARSLEVG